MDNIFEQATRRALRFDSPKGKLTVEDLWHLPLQASSKEKANLDDIAVSLHNQTKEVANSVSFVAPTANPKDDEVLLKFEVVKYIIGVRVKERDEAAVASQRSARKQQLLELLDRQENKALESKSPDEIRAMIAAL